MNIRGIWDDGDSIDRTLAIVAAVALVIGILARILALDAAPLSVDEYYLTVAAENTWTKGLPRWDVGGYYMRGLMQQYLAVPIAFFLGDMGLALRWVSLISNLAVLPAIFLLSRRLVGPAASLLAVALFSLSLWEIEFARFARMYAIFQAFYVWSVYFLVRYSETEEARFRNYVLMLSAVSIIVYEGAIFIVALNFLALFLAREKPKLSSVILPLAVLLAAFQYVRTDFRHIGVTQYLPGDYVSSGGGGGFSLPVEQPALLMTLLPDLWVGVNVLVLAACGVVCFMLFREDRRSNEIPLRSAWLTLFSLLAAMNMYGLAMGLALAVSLLGWQGRGWELSRNLVVLTGLHAALFSIWLGFLLMDREWLEVLWAGEYGFAKGLLWTLFGYPDFYSKFLIRWVQSMPMMTVLAFSTIGAGIGLALARGDSSGRGLRLLASIVVLMVLALCILRQEYRSIRYSFFLYPIVIVLFVASVDRLAALLNGKLDARLACALAVGGLLLVAEDFGVRHILGIDEPRYMYRMAYDRWREDQYYRRWDYEAPARYVNANAAPGDTVITTSHAVPYYLDQLDYFYAHMSSVEFHGISAEAGTQELWSGASLLYKEDSLSSTIETARGTVWLIIRSESFGPPRDEERELARRYADEKVFVTDDGNLEVYRVSARI